MIIVSPIKDETGKIKKNKKHDAPTKDKNECAYFLCRK